MYVQKLHLDIRQSRATYWNRQVNMEFRACVWVLLPRRTFSADTWFGIVFPLFNSQIGPTNMVLGGVSCVTFALSHSMLLLKALVAVFCGFVALKSDCVLDMLPDSVDCRAVGFVWNLLAACLLVTQW